MNQLQTQTTQLSPLMQFRDNSALDAEEKQRNDELSALQKQNTPWISSLSSYIDICWQAAKFAKQDVEVELFKCARQRKGEYDPADAAVIAEMGGADIYMMLTDIKCRSIEASVCDIIFQDRPWSLTRTPIPDMPDDINALAQEAMQNEVRALMMQNPNQQIPQKILRKREEELKADILSRLQQDAQDIATSQEDYIQDEFVQGEFYEELRKFIKDFATYPFAVFHGPFIRSEKRLVWTDMGQNAPLKPLPMKKLVRKYRRISPFDVYWSPGAKNLDSDGYVIIREKMRRRALISCIGVPGFDSAAIMLVLQEQKNGHLKDWLWTDSERSELENRPLEQSDPEGMIECLQFSGDIPGEKLLEWGMDRSMVPNPHEEYPANVWKIGHWVVMARLNAHVLGKRNIYVSSYEKQNDSISGKGPPQLMRDSQRVANSMARAAINNANFASGPQTEVHTDRVQAGEDITDIYAYKIWRTKSDAQGSNRKAVNFYQPPFIAKHLLDIYKTFYLQAGEQVGVPAYEHGSSETHGAGRTASGLAMLKQSSSKIIKDAIRNVDLDVIKRCVQETWLHLTIFDQIPEAGDINIMVRASEYMAMFDQLQILRRDWLAITNNPTDMQIIGIAGRAEVLRETAKQLKMPVDDIIPTKKEIEQQMIQAQQAQQAAEEQQREEQENAGKPTG